MSMIIEKIRLTKFGVAVRNSKLIKKVYINTVIKSKKQKLKKAFNADGIKVLSMVTEALNGSDIHYFAAFGTLLGFIRDGKMIPNDYDFDFGIEETPGFTWDMLSAQLAKHGFAIDHWYEHDGKAHEMTFYNKINPIVHVDFFLFTPENDRYAKYGYSRSAGADYEVFKEMLPLFHEYKIITVCGSKVPVPINAEEVIAASYTENWKTPDPNWSSDQKPHRKMLENTVGYNRKPN